MGDSKLGRRDALSGSLAVVLAAAPGVSKGDEVSPSTLVPSHSEWAQEDFCPSPFQKAFLAWFREDPKRFSVLVSVGVSTSNEVELRFKSIHPAIYITVADDFSTIDVYAQLEEGVWSPIEWFYAEEKPGPGGVGWVDVSVSSSIHPTLEALWLTNVFK